LRVDPYSLPLMIAGILRFKVGLVNYVS
jgi:hypothetical protein